MFFGNDCDDVISAETAMMVKEHFIEEFWRSGSQHRHGGSGGAIQQYMMAQNYPGLLDGLMPQVNFPDNAIFEGVIDCQLLDHAFGSTKTSWNDVTQPGRRVPKAGWRMDRLSVWRTIKCVRRIG